jgi:acyl carrier protein phosphodiesterase
MNFLSHLYLSGKSEELIIGNFIADSVKGSNYNQFPSEIKKGILLHRKIDSFTDSHLIVEQSKQRLREKYRKYAGVIIDIYYDHFLASKWNNFSAETLNDYAQYIYRLINKHQSLLPLKSLHFYNYMVKYNILTAYAGLPGIKKVLQGMASRTKFESNMQYAAQDLKEHYQLFEKEFENFFPELQQFVSLEIDTNL